MEKKQAFRVRFGNQSVTVWKHPQGWRFAYRSEGRWRYITRQTKAEAREMAEQVIEDMQHGLIWAGLAPVEREFLHLVRTKAQTEDDRRAVLDFLRARGNSRNLERAVKLWMDAKERKAGELSPYLRDLNSKMTGFYRAFPGRKVTDVSYEALARWIEERTEGKPKLYIDLRANLIEFFRWCRRQGYVSASEVPVPERLPEGKRPKGGKRVASLEELVGMLNEIGERWRVWVVLGAWAGMRPEEVSPKQWRKKKDKRGLHCEDIDWNFGVLRIPPEVSKVGVARVVPMCEALKLGLEWAGIRPGMIGPVCLQNPTEEKETKRVAAKVFGGQWPKDILRHSYASNRNALIRNLAQLAEEMGTSERMLHGHYHNPRAEEEGRQWFECVRPKMSDESGFHIASSRWEIVENGPKTPEIASERAM